MHLAEAALLRAQFDAEARSDDLRGLDGPGQDARHEGVDGHGVRAGEAVPQGFGLHPPEVRQTRAAGAAADHPVEPGVGSP